MNQNELLYFVMNFFEEMRIHARIIHEPYKWDDSYDLELRSTLLKKTTDIRSTFFHTEENLHEKNRVFLMIDLFSCHYICVPIPGNDKRSVLFIGPFAVEDITLGFINSIAERLKIPEVHFAFLTQYYTALPVLRDRSCMRSILTCLCNRIYKDSYQFITQKQTGHMALEYDTSGSIDANQEVTKAIELRYQNEQALMDAISKGDYNAARDCLTSKNNNALAQRLADTIRDKKNYLIIFNTLCRKAAQYGGVHPVYLDELSSRFAIQLETLHSISRLNALAGEMVYKYSLLVQNHSTRSFSPLIQKTVDFICLNLREDLSLCGIAKRLCVNKSYLSTAFKRETGSTLTDFVTERRISHALYLLNTTDAPIQEIACDCGIADMSYFTKIFRQKKGMTPSHYRKLIQCKK